MLYIDPHIHMVSRTTDDYESMAAAGVKAIIEPAFWQKVSPGLKSVRIRTTLRRWSAGNGSGPLSLESATIARWA